MWDDKKIAPIFHFLRQKNVLLPCVSWAWHKCYYMLCFRNEVVITGPYIFLQICRFSSYAYWGLEQDKLERPGAHVLAGNWVLRQAAF